jgi:Rps23 Pro-64 3,4-dihydroxylase Tpa1-like proline 4-hydroxylase
MIKIIDNFLDEKLLIEIEKNWPDKNSKCWYKRTDSFQKNQYGCNKKDLIPDCINNLLDYFNSEEFIKYINSFLNIKNLKSDDVLHGGGITQYGKDGYLDLHLDYDIHPLTKKQRRANILLYLNKDWKEDWGGALELYNKDKFIDKVYPKYNRLVIFEVDENSWHGFPKPLKCPENEFRKSINVYYVTEPIKKHCDRPRAYFVPGPLDSNNKHLNIKNWGIETFKKRDEYLKNVYIKQYNK